MVRSVRFPIALCTVLALAACQEKAPAQPESDVVPLPPSAPAPTASAADPAPAPRAAPAVPAGDPLSVPPTEDEGTVQAAYVTQVHAMPEQNARLFSTAGGDPAVNGLYTHLALFQGPSEPWRVFRIGDFEAWEVAEEAPGRVVLQVRESAIGPETGSARTTARKLIVQWSGPTAEAISVTPAR